jgi:hypothetical protein
VHPLVVSAPSCLLQKKANTPGILKRTIAIHSRSPFIVSNQNALTGGTCLPSSLWWSPYSTQPQGELPRKWVPGAGAPRRLSRAGMSGRD